MTVFLQAAIAGANPPPAPGTDPFSLADHHRTIDGTNNNQTHATITDQFKIYRLIPKNKRLAKCPTCDLGGH